MEALLHTMQLRNNSCRVLFGMDLFDSLLLPHDDVKVLIGNGDFTVAIFDVMLGHQLEILKQNVKTE